MQLCLIAKQPAKIESEHPDYLCKWAGLPYSECTWEDGQLISKKFPKHVEDFINREKSQKIPSKICRVC